MRSVYVVLGGISRLAKTRPAKTFPTLVSEAYDIATADMGIEHPQRNRLTP